MRIKWIPEWVQPNWIECLTDSTHSINFWCMATLWVWSPNPFLAVVGALPYLVLLSFWVHSIISLGRWFPLGLNWNKWLEVDPVRAHPYPTDTSHFCALQSKYRPCDCLKAFSGSCILLCYAWGRRVVEGIKSLTNEWLNSFTPPIILRHMFYTVSQFSGGIELQLPIV